MDARRYRDLLRRLAAGDADVETVAERSFAALQRLYAEPSRHYHTAAHVDFCLSQFDRARTHMDEPDMVELALWFHDAVYDVRACDNELRSAALCEHLLTPLLPRRRLDRLRDLILVTAAGSQPADNDEAFVYDIDLSVFARPWEEFRDDSEAVRRESEHLDTGEFARRQAQFLRSLLARPAIYCTALFRDRCENAARDNITRWLQVLDRQLAGGA